MSTLVPAVVSRSLSLRYSAARWLVACTLFLLGAGGEAHARAPHELVSDVVGRVMDRLDTTIVEDQESQAALLDLFEQELSPHLAFATITRWIAGERWDGFSGTERDELMAAVHTHIVHVYAALLARGRTVEITIDPNSVVKTRSAKVTARMQTPDGRGFNLEFRLLRDEDQWKLFDLAVDGLSFTRSLRAELGPVISEGGVAGLRSYLDKHR